jgi:hypothetical protein
MADSAPTRVLLVTDRIAISDDLRQAICDRAARGPVEIRMLVPNPAPAEWHPRHPERHAKAEEAQRVLAQTLPELRGSTGAAIDGSVSTRHDPVDAIEEILHDEPIDELIIATTPHHARRHRPARASAPRAVAGPQDAQQGPRGHHRRVAARRPPPPRGSSRVAGDRDHRRARAPCTGRLSS